MAAAPSALESRPLSAEKRSAHSGPTVTRCKSPESSPESGACASSIGSLERLLTIDRDAVHRAAAELVVPERAQVLAYHPVADAESTGADDEGSAA